MPIATPARDPLPQGLLEADLVVDEMLYEVSTPIIYVTHTVQNQPLLAYVADDSGDFTTTLLAPLSSALLDEIKRGALGIREALSSSWLWMHVSNGQNSNIWVTAINEIPDLHLPIAGTPLLVEHEPVFRTRAIGEEVVLGKMPASVVAFVADATRRAFKIILDFKFETRAEGRPTEEHRALYDLPIQQFAFASFELSFGAPDEGFFPREAVREAAVLLMDGLRWASEVNNREPLLGETDEQRAAVLRAALLLTPPLTGAIEEVQVSGLWVPRERVRLTRESRRKVKAELRTVDQDHVVAYNGRIREVDIDNLSFILRDTDDGQDRKGYIGEEHLDDVLLYLLDSVRVTVAGIERQGRLYVAAVAPYTSSADQASSSAAAQSV
jgi:hypothetical protein